MPDITAFTSKPPQLNIKWMVLVVLTAVEVLVMMMVCRGFIGVPQSSNLVHVFASRVE